MKRVVIEEVTLNWVYQTHSIIEIRDNLYKDATIYLTRKHERFYQPDKYKVH